MFICCNLQSKSLSRIECVYNSLAPGLMSWLLSGCYDQWFAAGSVSCTKPQPTPFTWVSMLLHRRRLSRSSWSEGEKGEVGEGGRGVEEGGRVSGAVADG